MAAISLTESAKNHIVKTLETMDKPYLVFGLKGGGCAGFEYFWVPVTEQEYTERGEPDKDIIVDLANDKKLIVDNSGLLYLLGSTIDYKSDFVSSSLVVDNPNATGGCGCGTSVAF
jgi:iron-sulfur cluster assembly protein